MPRGCVRVSGRGDSRIETKSRIILNKAKDFWVIDTHSEKKYDDWAFLQALRVFASYCWTFHNRKAFFLSEPKFQLSIVFHASQAGLAFHVFHE